MLAAVLLAVNVWFGTYSVLDVGKPGVPALTSSQQRWLHLIHSTKAYAARWPHLRFAPQPPPTHSTAPKQPPLIVFDPLEWTGSPSDPGANFHVIGEPCNAYYAPVSRSYIGPSDSACSNDHTPAPVADEARFLQSGP